MTCMVVMVVASRTDPSHPRKSVLYVNKIRRNEGNAAVKLIVISFTGVFVVSFV